MESIISMNSDYLYISDKNLLTSSKKALLKLLKPLHSLFLKLLLMRKHIVILPAYSFAFDQSVNSLSAIIYTFF